MGGGMTWGVWGRWGGGGRDRPYGSDWADLSHVAFEAAGRRHSHSQRCWQERDTTNTAPACSFFLSFFFSFFFVFNRLSVV